MAETIKNIAIWGFGREGQAGQAYLKELHPNADFTIIEQGNEDSHAEKIASGYYDIILKSPGVSLYKPEIQSALQNGTNVTSGTNLWFERYPDACVVAVTGTKGKSTTSAIIHHMLQKCGIHSVLAGNIGTPLIEVEPAEVVVAELSSYQIADLKHHPEIAVLTNLYEAHLEWHGGRTQYHKDKMRLFDLSEDTTTLISKDDEVAKAYLKDRDNVLFYGSNTGDLKIPEVLSKPHNIKNIAAALTVVEVLNAISRLPTNALMDFEALPHRQEVIGERDGITFINDSISTVPETAAVALESFNDKPVALILGGEEKGQDYNVVNKAIQKHGNVKVFCIPDSGILLANRVMNAEFCDNLETAVQKSQSALNDNGYVILSPGTPSFPIYKNYVERGEHFRKLCGF
ncbi:MAG: UDP-N-acetylmuramoyl-L-alanine--D-glutamate ligase [Pseudomonadota bacterium]